MIPITDEWALRERHEGLVGLGNEIVFICIECYKIKDSYFNFCAYTNGTNVYLNVCNGCKKPLPDEFLQDNFKFYIKLLQTFGG